MVDDRGPTRRRRAPTTDTTIAALVLTLVGCSGLRTPDLPGPGTRLTADDFSAGGPTRRADHPIPAYIAERPRAPRVAIRSISEAEARGGVEGVDTAPGSPTDLAGTPRQPPAPADQAIETAGLTLVDSKIGDLNGVPILARSWLEPLGARLRAESVGKGRAEWRYFAAEQINQRLVGNLRDELFLAEARSSLTAEQKAGLRVFLRRFEQDVVRSSYGSQTLADEQLRASSGLGLDEALRQRERDTLIYTETQKIGDRVQVPWRDIKLEYERRAAEFSPPPRAVFRMIRLDSGQPDLIAEFTEALRTSDFAALADDPRNQTPDETVIEVRDGYEQTSFFGPEELQAAAVGLSPGRWAGPIPRGSFTFWIGLDRIDRESRSLYEVQKELRDQLVGQRRDEEARRYLLRLFERAGITGLNQLVDRLVLIAEQWYYEGAAG